MKRRFTMMVVAAPLALGLAHCTDAEEATDEAELAAQVVRPADAGPRDLSEDAGTGGARDADAGTATAVPFTISTTVVQDKGMLPKKYRGNVPSPAFTWAGGPEGTKSYALILRDLGNNFFHWVIYDIPATETGLPENVPIGATLTTKPVGAKQAPNWSGRVGYGGPAAPSGVSNYAFTLYALDVEKLPGLAARATSAQVLAAILEHDLASTKLTIQSTPSAP